MFYIIYKTTNRINGKIYIGSHKTKDLNDTYLGSGKYLNHAVKKHGIENFQKEILFVFDNPADMYAKEAELVNDEFLAEANTYNLKKGGFGGWNFLNQNRERFITPKYTSARRRATGNYVKALAKHRELCNTDTDYVRKHGQTMSASLREGYANGRRKSFLGRKHSQHTKQIISQKSKIHQAGEGNSQYGTRWITNNMANKKIKKDDPIPAGWVLGRTTRN